MSSLVDRLGVRSDRKQFYTQDESDDDADLMPRKSQRTLEKFERVVRSDTKKDSCQACGKSGNLLSCKRCTYLFHTGCLLSPLKSSHLDNWMCPECVSPLIDIDKILDYKMRPIVAGESGSENLGSKQSLTKQYLVKWRGLSYMHCVLKLIYCI